MSGEQRNKYFMRKRAVSVPKEERSRYYGPTSKSYQEAEVDDE